MVASAPEPENRIIPPITKRYRRWRKIKDYAARYYIIFGGVSVIITITLVFFYLLYVVIPLFHSAQITPTAQYVTPGGSMDATVYLALNEYNDTGFRLTDQGRAIFFSTQDGKVVLNSKLPIPEGVAITSFTASHSSREVIAYGLSNGRGVFLRPIYQTAYTSDNVRTVTPRLEYPLGNQPLVIDSKGQPLHLISAQSNKEQTTIAAVTADNRLILVNFIKLRSFADEKTIITQTDASLDLSPLKITHIIIGGQQEELYLIDTEGYINYYRLIGDEKTPNLIQRVRVVPLGTQVTALSSLTGGISLLVGDSSGQIAQWFPVRDENNHYSLVQIRTFNAQKGPIKAIAPEHARKGFLAADSLGYIGLYHATAHRILRIKRLSKAPLSVIGIAPRANGMLAGDLRGKIRFLRIDNKHPEVSWQALWGKVWYESSQRPKFVWQSSASSNKLEPKFSLTPLIFGTFKGAFYAMLFAIPIAIMGAVYTAYFMGPKMRGIIKPIIEIMAALPTVILGFLAGLWLAPLVEKIF